MKPTVIALPGFLGRPSDWDAVRAATKAEAHWIRPDLFGANGSFDPPETDGPCWLAGYSFGARLALRWMQQAPDRWRGALLLSINSGNFQSDEERAARREADDRWAAAFQTEPWAEVVRRWNAQDVFAGSPAASRHEEDYDRTKLVTALREFSVSGQFADPLRLPDCLVWMAGGGDKKFVALQSEMRDAGFPGTFLVVEDAGHRLLLEAPEAVASGLDDLVA